MRSAVEAPLATRLKDVGSAGRARLETGLAELDRVLGGGFVPGSSLVLGGPPGAGKSTLLLQVACHVALRAPVVYVTGEESLQQVAMRAQRLGLQTDELLAIAETDVQVIEALIEQHHPALVVIDSIQVMLHPEVASAQGSVAQVRECAALLTRCAKRLETAIVMVGHVTKSENLAGPMTLNHLVDVTLMLAASDDSRFRFIRADKNRYGAVNELGVFAMTSAGLKEVRNPSAIFLNRDAIDAPGSVVTVLWEGTRPLLVEVQALADQSAPGSARRLSVGMDGNRLSMLLAILHRHGGVAVHDVDVYLNVVGGIRIAETSADLPVILSIYSSIKDKPIPRSLFAFGEIGLSGEVRPCSNGQERIKEAAKHGFLSALVPAGNVAKEALPGVQVRGVRTLAEALAAVFD
jgi:DNA repair protein RadA/Sms